MYCQNNLGAKKCCSVLRGKIGLKSFRNNRRLVQNRGVYRDFYTMKIEGKKWDLANCLVSREFRFTEVPVLRGSSVLSSKAFTIFSILLRLLSRYFHN